MILLGDCLERLKELEENSVDSVVTDPPAGISFMNKKWDGDKGGRDQWIAWLSEVMTEVKRVMKPGAHAFVWAIPRTSHWTAMALDNAGLEVRDCVYHCFGSGFPKSLAIDKAIDKHLGATREVIGEKDVGPDMRGGNFEKAEGRMFARITKPSTPEAHRYRGWGTSLKPAVECWWLVRKPISEKNVAANVLRWGVGGLNIDESRIGYQDEKDKKLGQSARPSKTSNANDHAIHHGGLEGFDRSERSEIQGRWPANLLLDEESAALLDAQVSQTMKMHKAGNKKPSDIKKGNLFGGIGEMGERNPDKYGSEDSIGASRFFYVAKASKRERNAGLEGMPERVQGTKSKHERNFSDDFKEFGDGESSGHKNLQPQKNFHPTVKPIKLMEYLCKLITPPGGTILDPFMGSGSTGVAAFKNNFKFIGIEMNSEYVAIAEKRIANAKEGA